MCTSAFSAHLYYKPEVSCTAFTSWQARKCRRRRFRMSGLHPDSINEQDRHMGSIGKTKPSLAKDVSCLNMVIRSRGY